VLLGRKYISPSIAEKLAMDLLLDGKGRLPHELLSEREFQVFLLLARGGTVSKIAGTIALSITTVSTYRSRILTKLNLRTNAELTRYAIDHDLI
jgi:two-component system, NarL family, invasion response regulator UvrY